MDPTHRPLKVLLVLSLAIAVVARASKSDTLKIHGFSLGGGLRMLQAHTVTDGHNGSSSGILVPLTGREGVVRRRSLLRAAVAPVEGAVREVGWVNDGSLHSSWR
jgi:hypothetical protein